jgi:hypothetical protein
MEGFNVIAQKRRLCKPSSAKRTKLEIEAGIDQNAYNAWGKTPLMVFAQRGNIEMVTLLLCHGANVCMPSMIPGRDALWYAIVYRNKECALALLRAGASFARWRLCRSDSHSFSVPVEIKKGVLRCRQAVLAILSRRLVLHPWLLKDLTRLVARALWSMRYHDEWHRLKI